MTEILTYLFLSVLSAVFFGSWLKRIVDDMARGKRPRHE